MLYTSGTTGRPKGVMLSFDNLIITGRNGAIRENLTEDEDMLAYLPMAWIGDNIFSVAQAYVTGFCVSCPESSETVLEDLREIGPTYFFAPPRIYESFLTTVMIRIEDAAKIKQHMFHFFMGVARRVGMDILDGKPVALFDRFLYWLGNILVYAPLKNVLGLSKVRVSYTAGEAIGPDIFSFYRSLGLNLKQMYASTEASVFITIQPDGEVRPETSGTPAIDVEVRVEDDGEVMFRSPGVFQSYYKNEEETKATKTEDGWVHTGDAGYLDADGHLHIIDRSKDVGKLKDGTLFAPKFIENKLKFFPHIKEAVTFGHDRDYVAAFINIDLESVGNWAERRNLPYSGPKVRARRPSTSRSGSRTTARSCSAAPAFSSPITRTRRRPRRPRPRTAGSIPATQATSTRTATCTSSTAPRTSASSRTFFSSACSITSWPWPGASAWTSSMASPCRWPTGCATGSAIFLSMRR